PDKRGVSDCDHLFFLRPGFSCCGESDQAEDASARRDLRVRSGAACGEGSRTLGFIGWAALSARATFRSCSTDCLRSCSTVCLPGSSFAVSWPMWPRRRRRRVSRKGCVLGLVLERGVDLLDDSVRWCVCPLSLCRGRCCWWGWCRMRGDGAERRRLLAAEFAPIGAWRRACLRPELPVESCQSGEAAAIGR